MRLESHHAHRQAACVGRRAYPRKQCLVTAMHAVEIADGQSARRPTFGVRKTPEDFHVARLMVWLQPGGAAGDGKTAAKRSIINARTGFRFTGAGLAGKLQEFAPLAKLETALVDARIVLTLAGLASRNSLSDKMGE